MRDAVSGRDLPCNIFFQPNPFSSFAGDVSRTDRKDDRQTFFFSRIRSAASQEMCPEQTEKTTDRQTNRQTANLIALPPLTVRQSLTLWWHLSWTAVWLQWLTGNHQHRWVETNDAHHIIIAHWHAILILRFSIYRHSYYRRRIGNHTQAFEWYRFKWSRMTDFNVNVNFNVKQVYRRL